LCQCLRKASQEWRLAAYLGNGYLLHCPIWQCACTRYRHLASIVRNNARYRQLPLIYTEVAIAYPYGVARGVRLELGTQQVAGALALGG
jgi:hypothetical protein